MNEIVFEIVKKVCLAIALVIAIFVIAIKLEKKHEDLTAHSVLTKLEKTEKLQTVTFEYGGIAYYFEGREKEYFKSGKKADTKIKYKADVKAVIDLKKLRESERIVDNKVYLTLPEVEYNITIETNKKEEDNTNTEQAFEIMGNHYTLKVLISACETDARYEIKNNKGLQDSVIENSKKTIEAFISPMIDKMGYDEIIWENEKKK